MSNLAKGGHTNLILASYNVSTAYIIIIARSILSCSLKEKCRDPKTNQAQGAHPQQIITKLHLHVLCCLAHSFKGRQVQRTHHANTTHHCAMEMHFSSKEIKCIVLYYIASSFQAQRQSFLEIIKLVPSARSCKGRRG